MKRRKCERGRQRRVWSPNLTLSINLTSSSRRKGPVCPGSLPDALGSSTPHCRHHYVPVFRRAALPGHWDTLVFKSTPLFPDLHR